MMTNVSQEVKEAVKILNENSSFNSMTLTEKQGVMISDDAVKAVKEAGYKIGWVDTFEGGTWYVSR